MRHNLPVDKSANHLVFFFLHIHGLLSRGVSCVMGIGLLPKPTWVRVTSLHHEPYRGRAQDYSACGT